jgi:hypothetical protein
VRSNAIFFEGSRAALPPDVFPTVAHGVFVHYVLNINARAMPEAVALTATRSFLLAE